MIKKFSIPVGFYPEIECIRKKHMHKPLKRPEMEEVLKDMKFPITPKAWQIYQDFKIFKKFGKARKTYYLISCEVYSLATLTKMIETLNKVERKSYPKSELTVPKCLKFLEARGYVCIPLDKYVKKLVSKLGQRH